jgi:hypothetical protein
MFGALAAYRKTHGNCDVPQSWPENRSLGHWCSHQRQLMRKGRLRADRKRRLERIGFDWRLCLR